MAAKQIVVLEQGVEGIVLNPTMRDRKNGGTEYVVPFKPVFKAAKKSKIERYVTQLENGKRLGMRGNNKVLAPTVRSLKPATPGSEVNKPATPQKSSGRPAKGSAEAKARMAHARAARKNANTDNNTTLVLSSKNDSNNQDALRRAIDVARNAGDWNLVETLVNELHS